MSTIMYVVILPLILCGYSYCFFSAGLWPSIPYVVEKKLLGSAYGIITSIQNLGLAIGPLIATFVVDNNKQGGNYRMLNFIQIIEAGIGVVFGILYWIYIRRKDKEQSEELIENEGMYHNKED